MAGVNSERKKIAASLQFELYKRRFDLFAKEQLKIKGAGPGQILPLDLKVKPLQYVLWQKVQQQLAGQGFVRGYILKGRQQGSSTASQGLMYWKASTTQNFDTMLMAHDGPTTAKLFSIARHFYDHVNPLYRPMSRYASKQELTFENPDPRSRFDRPGLRSHMDFTDASRPLAGTSQTRQGLHLTEAAKYKEETTHILTSSFLPMIHDLAGTYFINESTAFVTGNWFRAGCEEARSRKSRYFWIFSPWYNDPEYQLPLDPGERFVMTSEERRIVSLAAKGQTQDEVIPITVLMEQLKWRREKIREFEVGGLTANGEELFNQEFPLTFEDAWISWDNYVFHRTKVFQLQRKAPNPEIGRLVEGGPRGVRWMEGAVGQDRFEPDSDYRAVWEHPIPGKQYDLGVDVSAGIEGGDWSTIEVIQRFSNKQVAEIHLQCDATDLSEEIYLWGRYYNWGQVAVEFNSEGIAINQLVLRKNYPNIYFWRNRAGPYPKVTKQTGWKTNRESKQYMVMLCRSKFQRDEWAINSKWLLQEMSNFVQVESGDMGWSFGANVGHDDLIMAAMIAIVISDDEAIGLTAETNVAMRPRDLGIGGLAYKNANDPGLAFQEPRTTSEKNSLRRLFEGRLGIRNPNDDA